MLIKIHKLITQLFHSIKFVIFSAVLLMLKMASAHAVISASDKPESVVTKTPAVTGENIMGMVLSLVLVLVIILFLAWAAKRFGGVGFKGNSAMKVLAGISMGARERIVLIQVGEQQLLLGVAPGRIQTLHVLDEPVDMDSCNEPVASVFADRLKTILNKSK
ncbi:MAG: flagellar biosynthetic protein FliO [Gammaproteobacteria bacterium]|nr:flagellar biosynthetic protein FliO [Gammaproteobacteria bacterium]